MLLIFERNNLPLLTKTELLTFMGIWNLLIWDRRTDGGEEERMTEQVPLIIILVVVNVH